MTVIAYKDGIIAYDSYSYKGPIIQDFKAEKHRVDGDYHIFMAGALADFNYFIDAVCGRPWPKDHPFDVEALYSLHGKVYNCSITADDGFWTVEVNPTSYIAIGAGSDLAYAAMDCSRSAENAVKIACHRHVHCGGEVKTFKVW